MVKGHKPHIQTPSWEPPLSQLSSSHYSVNSSFPPNLLTVVNI